MKLPPSDFSNVLIDVKPGCDLTNWKDSPEWAIFNAGIAYAMSNIKWQADNAVTEAIRQIHSVRDKKS